MRSLHWTSLAAFAGIAALVACSATSTDSGFGGGTSGGAGGDPIGTGGSDQVGGSGGTSVAQWDASVSNNPDATGASSCSAGPDEDRDKDGWTITQGDCNDCDANANPGAFDVAGGIDGGPGVDEDCNGVIDDEPTNCGLNLSMTSVEPIDFARAIGLCRTAIPGAQGKDKTWGVLEAKLGTTDPNGFTDPKLFGILKKFGANNNPQEGDYLIALSSGTARDEYTGGVDPNGPGYETPIETNCPPGFPKNSPNCPDPADNMANDPVSFYLKLRVPTNAKSFSFNFSFFSAEYPEFVCTDFNDVFVALLHSKIPGKPADSNNISFDQNHAPVCVNIGFFGHTAGNDPVLTGTFMTNNRGGATGWLQTQAPVEPGEEITVQFAIWDTGDHAWDSTVIIDNFKWSVEPAGEAVTEPVPVPK